jgi:hypothetical protein
LRDGVDVHREALDEVSDAEFAILEHVANEFGAMSGWDLREYTHRNCPEWKDPCGSSNPISYEDIFHALGRHEYESDMAAKAIRADDQIDRVFARL